MKFHEGCGELTAEDVKFTVEQSFKPDALGGSAYFFRNHLDRIETPDKLTVVMHFKTRQWIVPSLFTQYVGYQNTISKKYFETVGEQKAATHPIGTGPFRHVEGKQGDYHRFEAVPNHWRKTPAFKELVIRRIPEAATRLSGLRAGEIDIAQVFGDYLEQAQKAGLAHPRVAERRAVLGDHDRPDHARPRGLLPAVPVGGRSRQPQEPGERAQGPAGPQPRGQQEGDLQRALEGPRRRHAVLLLLLSVPQGLQRRLEGAAVRSASGPRSSCAEAGHAGGFEVRVNPYVQLVAQDGPDVMEAVALDWEKIGIKVKRVPEATSSFGPKGRLRKTNKTFSVYGSPPFDEPVAGWERVIHSKGAFNLLLDGAYDEDDRRRHAGVRHRAAREADPGHSARSSTTATTASCSG